MTPGLVCAIHQPNVFPRFSTLAKILAADRWVIYDDVQHAARDYQHRCLLPDPVDPTRPDTDGSPSPSTDARAGRR